MKILHTVESYLPARHGMAEVVRQLSEGLVGRGHHVTVATSTNPARNTNHLNGVQVVSFELSGNTATQIQGNASDYVEFVKSGQFEIITCFAAQQWATDTLLPYLGALKARKVFVPTGFSALHSPAYQAYYAKMADWMHQFDANVFLSATNQDARFAREHGIINGIVIPNGASWAEFGPHSSTYLRKQLGIDPEATLLLHVGSYTGQKGHIEALDIYLGARVANSVLLFVGQDPDQIYQAFGRKRRYLEIPRQRLLSGKKVMVRTLSRQDTVQAFKEADLFLFPSRIECSPIVLFEAAAAGTPFLTTDVGNAREIAEWTGGGWIIPTDTRNHKGYARIEAGSRQLEDLIRQSELRKEMGNRALVIWQEKFTWERITDRYEELYQSLLGSTPFGQV